MIEFDVHLHLCEVVDHDTIPDDEEHHWHHVSHPFEAPAIPQVNDFFNFMLPIGVGGAAAWLMGVVQFIEWQADGSKLTPHVYMEQVNTSPSGIGLDEMTEIFISRGWKDEEEDDVPGSYFGMSMN